MAKTRLQYLKTKTANELCKEKISQDIDTEKVLCAGGEKGNSNIFRLRQRTAILGSVHNLHFSMLCGQVVKILKIIQTFML